MSLSNIANKFKTWSLFLIFGPITIFASVKTEPEYHCMIVAHFKNVLKKKKKMKNQHRWNNSYQCGEVIWQINVIYVEINTAELCGYTEYTVDICYGALI